MAAVGLRHRKATRVGLPAVGLGLAGDP